MMARKRKKSIVIIAILLITGFVHRTEALIPLPSTDMQQYMNYAQQGASMAQEIQLQYQNGMKIVQEIQNGGFGLAVNDLFGSILNGDFDRFGSKLKDFKESTQRLADQAKDKREQKRIEKQLRKQGMSKEEAKKAAAEQVAEKRAIREEKRMKKKIAQAEKKAKRQKSALVKGYNWLKNNSAVTDAVRSGAMSAQYGDWGGVAGSTLFGVGGVLTSEGKNKSGNILSSVSRDLGNTVTSAMHGDVGSVINSAGASLGNGMNAGGKKTTGNILTNVATGVGNATTAIQNGSTSSAINSLTTSAGDAFNAGGRKKTGSLLGAAGRTVSRSVDAVTRGNNAIDIGTRIADDQELLNNAVTTFDLGTKAYTDYKAKRKKTQQPEQEEGVNP